ncbi:MAG: ABC transporter ATP-binding protein [Pseudomonadota bacterium]
MRQADVFATELPSSAADPSQLGALEVRSLSYRASSSSDGVVLLDDISFDVPAGKILAVVGPNGAGKTTLIRLIAGLMKPSDGDVRLDERSIHSLGSVERARQVAYVGQSEEPDGRLTVTDYVRMGRLPHEGFFASDNESNQAAQAIDGAGLKAIAHRRLDSLSGGERQRAKIARALCQQPALLVLDEPTNHLDPSARGELLGLVAAMGISVVVALHDLTLIDALASDVAVIAGGRLVAFGPPAEALSTDRVRHVFRVDLLRLAHPTDERHIPALDIALENTRGSRSTL